MSTSPETITANTQALFTKLQQLAASRPYIEQQIAKLEKEIAAQEQSLKELLTKLGYDPAINGPDAQAYLTAYAENIAQWADSHRHLLGD